MVARTYAKHVLGPLPLSSLSPHPRPAFFFMGVFELTIIISVRQPFFFLSFFRSFRDPPLRSRRTLTLPRKLTALSHGMSVTKSGLLTSSRARSTKVRTHTHTCAALYCMAFDYHALALPEHPGTAVL
jgi:hypothetical protein